MLKSVSYGIHYTSFALTLTQHFVTFLSRVVLVLETIGRYRISDSLNIFYSLFKIVQICYSLEINNFYSGQEEGQFFSYSCGRPCSDIFQQKSLLLPSRFYAEMKFRTLIQKLSTGVWNTRTIGGQKVRISATPLYWVHFCGFQWWLTDLSYDTMRLLDLLGAHTLTCLYLSAWPRPKRTSFELNFALEFSTLEIWIFFELFFLKSCFISLTYIYSYRGTFRDSVFGLRSRLHDKIWLDASQLPSKARILLVIYG